MVDGTGTGVMPGLVPSQHHVAEPDALVGLGLVGAVPIGAETALCEVFRQGFAVRPILLRGPGDRCHVRRGL